MFVEGMLWIVRTGSPWRGSSGGVWGLETACSGAQSVEHEGRLVAQSSRRCPNDPDFEYLIVDSTIVRGASAHAAGAKKEV